MGHSQFDDIKHTRDYSIDFNKKIDKINLIHVEIDNFIKYVLTELKEFNFKKYEHDQAYHAKINNKEVYLIFFPYVNSGSPLIDFLIPNNDPFDKIYVISLQKLKLSVIGKIFSDNYEFIYINEFNSVKDSIINLNKKIVEFSNKKSF